MSSPNPGISAAGEAAGRTALNPATGPAAIGGMLVPGPEPSAEAVALQTRLTNAVSEIAKLADSVRALALSREEEAALQQEVGAPGETYRERSGGQGGPLPSLTSDATVGGNGTTHRRFGLGATASVTTNVMGDTALSIGSDGPFRPAAPQYRI
jgi:hypothetical protein